MRRWGLRALVVLAIALAVGGVVKREEITRLAAVQTLFDADRIVGNFSDMGALFHDAPMTLGDPRPSPLPAGARAEMPGWLGNWQAERGVTGMVVLKDGAVVHEDYFHGTGPADRRVSWSVAKSFLAALMGVVLADGDIASLDDPVTRYAPELIGSGYDGATIRNVLNMASGVEFDEDYLDFWSDINAMGRVIALGGSLDGFAAGITDTVAAPGTEWHYVSIDTHAIGMVIRGATGRDIPDLMAEKILTPLGLESDAYYLADGHGAAFVLGGLNMATRDYARFGQMIAQRGLWQGREVVPAAWVDEMTAESAPYRDGMKARYGYQWWLPVNARPGEVFAIGVYGQYIWIDRTAGVVIAVNSADRGFAEDGVFGHNIDVLRAITEAVQ